MHNKKMGRAPRAHWGKGYKGNGRAAPRAP